MMRCSGERQFHRDCPEQFEYAGSFEVCTPPLAGDGKGAGAARGCSGSCTHEFQLSRRERVSDPAISGRPGFRRFSWAPRCDALFQGVIERMRESDTRSA